MSSNNVGQYFGPILSTESDVINCVRAFLSTVTQCIKTFQMGCAMHNVESRLLIVAKMGSFTCSNAVSQNWLWDIRKTDHKFLGTDSSHMIVVIS